MLYVYLDGLARFIELNCEGFRKALKKHDKVLAGLGQTLLKDNYMPIVALKCCQRNRPLVEVGLWGMCAAAEVPHNIYQAAWGMAGTALRQLRCSSAGLPAPGCTGRLHQQEAGAGPALAWCQVAGFALGMI